MQERTYKYFNDQSLYPFGFGLSYTEFKYSGLTLPKTIKAEEVFSVTVNVEKYRSIVGIDVVHGYIIDVKESLPAPIKSGQGFNPGEIKTDGSYISPYKLSFVFNKVERIIEPGRFIISAGGIVPDTKAEAQWSFKKHF